MPVIVTPLPVEVALSMRAEALNVNPQNRSTSKCQVLGLFLEPFEFSIIWFYN